MLFQSLIQPQHGYNFLQNYLLNHLDHLDLKDTIYYQKINDLKIFFIYRHILLITLLYERSELIF